MLLQAFTVFWRHSSFFIFFFLGIHRCFGDIHLFLMEVSIGVFEGAHRVLETPTGVFF